MSTNISAKEAKAVLKKIKLLIPANPKMDDESMMSRKQTVFYMAKELIRMTSRGFTNKELSELLINHNIPIKTCTLNRYLKEYQLEQKKVSPEKSNQQLEISGDAKAEPKSLAQDSEPSHSETPGKSELGPVKSDFQSLIKDGNNSIGNFGKSESGPVKSDSQNWNRDKNNLIDNPGKSELGHDKSDSRSWSRDKNNPIGNPEKSEIVLEKSDSQNWGRDKINPISNSEKSKLDHDKSDSQNWSRDKNNLIGNPGKSEIVPGKSDLAVPSSISEKWGS